MFSGKREKALLEEELAALRETEKRERELLHKIAGQKDTAEEQFARMTASRAQMEKEIEEIEQQMQQNGELSENGAQAAGELHNTLITMNNGIATFDANHSVFMEQVKGQNEKVVEIVENNKHFTTPMKHISEAPQAASRDAPGTCESAERMEELSKTMGCWRSILRSKQEEWGERNPVCDGRQSRCVHMRTIMSRRRWR